MENLRAVGLPLLLGGCDPLPMTTQHHPPDVSKSNPSEDVELAHLDDAVIGRATRWSIIAFVLLVAAGVATFFWLRRKPEPPPARMTALSAPAARAPSAAKPPNARFADITREAGIQFVHFNGAEGEKLLPETMGGGGAFLDFDNDGAMDIVFVNGAPWPWAKNPPANRPTHALYRNQGGGTFADVTRGSGLDVSFYGMGVACGDYDGDGRVDIFITAVGENHLFRNLGNGRFEDVTAAAGVGGDPSQWSSSAAFLDIDLDGDLDLFVANYVQWSREIDFKVGYSLDGEHRAYGPPMNFQGALPYLYRNEGNGRFVDISATAGVQIKNSSTGVAAAKSLGVAPADINGDGWIDIIVANDTVQNYVFTNRHDGTFAETGAALGVAFGPIGDARGAMGIDVARHRNNDVLGIGIGNFANEMTALYVSQGTSGTFADEAIPEGIGPASRLPLKFGLFFFDYDLDGWIDLLTANGHLEEEISKIQRSQTYQQPAQLFWNSGETDATFVEVGPDQAGPALFQPIVGRGSAYADIDADGDLDVLIFQTGGAPLLLRNDQALDHAWVRLSLQGSKSNRDAIGAWVGLTANGRTQWRQVMPTRSYLSQSELPVTFGLKNAKSIDRVEILWPGNRRQEVANIALNRTTSVTEP